MQERALNIIASRIERRRQCEPRGGDASPRGVVSSTGKTGASWAGLGLLRRKPLGRDASYRQGILSRRDARGRCLASKGFAAGKDGDGTPTACRRACARTAQVRSCGSPTACRASCCVSGLYASARSAVNGADGTDAESPLNSRSFRLDAGSWRYRESHGHEPVLRRCALSRACSADFADQATPAAKQLPPTLRTAALPRPACSRTRRSIRGLRCDPSTTC